jgi:VanZ family protein
MFKRLPAQPRFWWFLFAAWLITLQVLSSMEGSRHSTQLFPQSDKLLHLLYFCGGGTGLAIALRLHWESRIAFWKPLLWATVIATGTVVGAFDEWHQSFVPNRSGNSLADWSADILGSTLACMIYPFFWRILRIRP